MVGSTNARGIYMELVLNLLINYSTESSKKNLGAWSLLVDGKQNTRQHAGT